MSITVETRHRNGRRWRVVSEHHNFIAAMKDCWRRQYGLAGRCWLYRIKR